jgi:hypothetical protein
MKLLLNAAAASKCVKMNDLTECAIAAGCDGTDFKCICSVYNSKIQPCAEQAAGRADVCDAATEKSLLDSYRESFREFCVEKGFQTDIPEAPKKTTDKPSDANAMMTKGFGVMFAAVAAMVL